MRVRADVFPAKVAIAPPSDDPLPFDFHVGGTYPPYTRRLDRCRVVVMDDQILIAVDAPNAPQLVFQEKITIYQKILKRHEVTTITGKTLAFQKDANCGCGSRLRSWSPYGKILTVESE